MAIDNPAKIGLSALAVGLSVSAISVLPGLLTSSDTASVSSSVTIETTCRSALNVRDWLTVENNTSTLDLVFAGDGCKPEPFASDPESDEYYPASAPDGSKIVFVRGTPDSPERELVLRSITGGEERVLLRSPSLIGDPNWSPDGTSIAYWSSAPEGRTVLSIVEVGSAKSRSLTDASALRTRPRWSPDGRSILSVRSDAEGARVELWSEGGGDPLVLKTGDGPHSMATWSPDGTQVAFVQAGAVSKVSIFDLESDQVVSSVEIGRSTPLDMLWDDEGILVGTSGSAINEWVMTSVKGASVTELEEVHLGQSMFNAREDVR